MLDVRITPHTQQAPHISVYMIVVDHETSLSILHLMTFPLADGTDTILLS